MIQVCSKEIGNAPIYIFRVLLGCQGQSDLWFSQEELELRASDRYFWNLFCTHLWRCLESLIFSHCLHFLRRAWMYASPKAAASGSFIKSEDSPAVSMNNLYRLLIRLLCSTTPLKFTISFHTFSNQPSWRMTPVLLLPSSGGSLTLVLNLICFRMSLSQQTNNLRLSWWPLEMSAGKIFIPLLGLPNITTPKGRLYIQVQAPSNILSGFSQTACTIRPWSGFMQGEDAMKSSGCLPVSFPIPVTNIWPEGSWPVRSATPTT